MPSRKTNLFFVLFMLTAASFSCIGSGRSSNSNNSQTAPTNPPTTQAPSNTGQMRLLNNSGSHICYVYISPSDSSNWGNDWLGPDDGIMIESTRAFDVPVGLYDLRAEDCEHGILDEQMSVTINNSGFDWSVFSGGGGSTTGTANFILENKYSEAMCSYILTNQSTGEAYDILVGGRLEPGQSITYEFPVGEYCISGESCSGDSMASNNCIDLFEDLTKSIISYDSTLTLRNNSGQSICYVYFSYADSDSWGGDWLGDDEVIRHGETRDFNVASDTWDMRAEDCDHNIIDEVYNVVIPENGISWTVDQSTGSSSIGSQMVTISYRNASNHLYCSIILTGQSGEGSYELLAEGPLQIGQTVSFAIPPGYYCVRRERCDGYVNDSTCYDIFENRNRVISPPDDGSSSNEGSNGGQTANLTLVSESNESVCSIIMTDQSSGDAYELLSESSLLPGQSVTFSFPLGNYCLEGTDCDGDPFLHSVCFELDSDVSYTLVPD